ncbi:MAG: quinolinate synthetase [Beggiatoa sp. IS2]|nr:MAG: quinolinate synthetase [Beggiatoa sp. IS2]
MKITELAIEKFLPLEEAECDARISTAKATLGKRVTILGHHYQRQEVFKYADYSGDSLKLSRYAAQSGSEYIVFCGVHFMAEVADILTNSAQKVVLPDLAAGCSMADMANLRAVERVWQELSTVLDADKQVTPVTYINSVADLKAFCGQHGGIICTSSNARQVLEWSFQQREKVLFFPDEHLGRYTGYSMGIPLEQMVVWDFAKPLGGLTVAQIEAAKMLLWKGFCSVHQMFTTEDIDSFRETYPEAKVISHPECAFDVCQKSDAVGSTEFIVKTIKASPPGTRWLVGTEWNLVNRLAQESRTEGKWVHFMSPMMCWCSTMYRIDQPHLLWALENLVAGQVVNQITVPPAIAEQARVALERMLAVSP